MGGWPLTCEALTAFSAAGGARGLVQAGDVAFEGGPLGWADDLDGVLDLGALVECHQFVV